MKRCAIFCLAAVMLAACGQSGGLYLPGGQAPKQQGFFEKKDQRKDDGSGHGTAPAQPDSTTSVPQTQPQPETQPQTQP